MFKNAVVKNKPVFQFSKSGIQALLIGFAMLTVAQSTGCKLGIKEASMLTYRDTVWSKRAYNLRYGNCEREYSEHFENGFRAGYMETSNGGDGYVPALPPQAYRAPEYQSEDGAKCVNSWFEGYPAGVAAARKDKSGTYHDVLISRMIDSAVSQSKTKPVLPGDVRIVSNTQDRDNASGNQVPGGTSPAWTKQAAPPTPTPNGLTPSSYSAPPQADASPDPTGQAEVLAETEMDDAALQTATAASNTTQILDSDQPLLNPGEAVEKSIFNPLLPAVVTPANWDQPNR